MSTPGTSTAAPPPAAAAAALATTPSTATPPPTSRRWFKKRRANTRRVSLPNTEPESKKKKCFSYIYDKQTKKFLGRTGRGWLKIISYSIIYLMFLITYMLFFLYISLLIVRSDGPKYLDKGYLFEEEGIGLSAVPSALGAYPLISYTDGDAGGYEPYVESLRRLLGAAPPSAAPRGRRDTRRAELGPCGVPPFGYGREPCVIIRINKQLGWQPKPLTPGSSTFKQAPTEVQDWASRDRKLWLYCSGYYPWDKEHIGVVQYHPHPPGFDPARYPVNMTSESQLIAVQFTKFTLGMSLVVQCKLFSESGSSKISFILYVGKNKNNDDVEMTLK